MKKDARQRYIGAAVVSGGGFILVALSRSMDDSNDMVCGWWDADKDMWNTIDAREFRHVQSWIKEMPIVVPPDDDTARGT